MNTTLASVDPFTLEVMRHAFSAIAEEMSLVVMRSARSPLLREAGDLSSAITDADGELVAQGRDIPMHMGVMSFTVKEFLKHVPVERLNAGDVWFFNLPEIGVPAPIWKWTLSDICTSMSVKRREYYAGQRGSVHTRGHAPRVFRHCRGNVPGGDALGTLAVAARGR